MTGRPLPNSARVRRAFTRARAPGTQSKSMVLRLGGIRTAIDVLSDENPIDPCHRHARRRYLHSKAAIPPRTETMSGSRYRFAWASVQEPCVHSEHLAAASAGHATSNSRSPVLDTVTACALVAKTTIAATIGTRARVCAIVAMVGHNRRNN